MKYSDDIETRMTGRHKKCLALQSEVKDKRIMNIGCYNGWYEQAVVAGGCRMAVGVDVDPHSVRLAAKAVPKASFVDASVLNLPFAGAYFDQVAMFDVIEHVPRGKEGEALKEVRRVLKTGGTLLLSTPNNHLLSNMLDPAWWLIGHRHYHRERICNYLLINGFSVTSIGCYGGIIELISMLFLYLSKRFSREIPFKGFSDTLRDREYLEQKDGFVTIFVTAQAVDLTSTNSILQSR